MKLKIYLALLITSVYFNIAFSQTSYDKAIKEDDFEIFKSSDFLNEDSTIKIDVLNNAINTNAKNVFNYLVANVNINSNGSDGNFPLLSAVNASNTKYVEALLKAKADINFTQSIGLKGTALMYAASLGNLELVKQLLSYGANINQLDINGDHALNWAAYSGKVNTTSYLIKKGASLSQKSKHGTALDVALRLWHNDSLLDIFRKSSITRKLSKIENQFFKALKQSNYKVLKSLIEEGVSPNILDGIGVPAIQSAIQNNNPEMVSFLIKKGANVNTLNRVGQTPIAHAAKYGSKNIVKLLLENNADTNLTGEDYKLTPIMAAAMNGDEEIGKQLISYGANVDTQDIVNGSSSLHWAIMFKHIGFAKMLLEHGANYNLKAFENKYSALDIAKAYKLNDLVSLIESLSNSDVLNGSWKIEEIQYQYPDTTYVRNDKDLGRFIFSKNRYALMYYPFMMDRDPFKVLSKPTDEEIKKAFQTMVFNSGSYTIENDVITTTADLAKVPGFEGGKQFYKLDTNDTIKLIMYDETYPDGSKPEWIGKIKFAFILRKEK